MDNSMTSPAVPSVPALTSAVVLDFLREHPDFLQQHGDALQWLQPPSSRRESGNVADFQAFQIRALQQQLRQQQAQLQELMTNARGNLDILDNVHRCVLALLACRTLEAAWDCMTRYWPKQLGLLTATLAVEKPKGRAVPEAFASLSMVPAGTALRLLGRPLPLATPAVILSEKTVASRFLFGTDGLNVHSDAILLFPATTSHPTLLLAMGAPDAGHFHPEQGTDLLLFLGRATQEFLGALTVNSA
jgi:hypothetical protein